MATLPRTRWFAVGTSNHSNPHLAGERAASRALSVDGVARPSPRLLILFCSNRYDPEPVLRGVNAVSGGAPLVGCTTAGEISSDGASDEKVVVAALGGPGFTVSTSLSTDLGGRPPGETRDGAGPGGSGPEPVARHREAGAEAAACAEGVRGSAHRILLLLLDGLGGGHQEVIRGAYGVVGAEIPLIGGGGGNGHHGQRSVQFFHDRVLTDAVVAAAIGADSPFGVGVGHGWQRVGSPLRITASDGKVIFELDDRPALDEYLRRLRAPAEARTDPTAFARFSMTHPLGMIRRGGVEEMRYVAAADYERRALVCGTEVPQGGLIALTEGGGDTILQATEAACGTALERLGGAAPIGFLAFDCVARRLVLGEDGVRSEAATISSFAGQTPVCGFYTFGEIARVRGINGYHNETLVMLALS